MSEKNKRLENIGYVLSGLGGLLVIINISREEDTQWGLYMVVLAAALALAGIMVLKRAGAITNENKT